MFVTWSFKIFLIIRFVTATSLAKSTPPKTTLVHVGSEKRHPYPHLPNKLYASLLSWSTCVNTSSWPQRRTAPSHDRTRAAPTPHRRYPRFTHRFSITGRCRAVFLRSRSLLENGRCCWDTSNLSSITSQHPTISAAIETTKLSEDCYYTKNGCAFDAPCDCVWCYDVYGTTHRQMPCPLRKL